MLALAGLMIAAQTLLLTSPKGYVSAFHFSLHTVASNIVYYGKTLSYVWQNGFSKRNSDRFRASVYSGGDLGSFLKSTVGENEACREFYLLRIYRRFAGVELRNRTAWACCRSLPAVFLLWTEGELDCRILGSLRLPVRFMTAAVLVGTVVR